MSVLQNARFRRNLISLIKRLCGIIPAKPYLKVLFRREMGYKLDLKHPKTFQEKLQWLKLFNRQPEYKRMVDKVAVKEYVKDVLGEEYVVPTLAIWKNPDEIDWDILPNQFVLKTSHGGGSGGVVICIDKQSFDKENAIRKLKGNCKQDIWRRYKEWQYKGMPRQIFAEQYLNDDATSVRGDLNDYKFYCFNGEVTFCEVITGRRTKKQIDFFDLEWNHLDFTFDGFEYADKLPEKPYCFDKMIEAAKVLCKNKPYSRIDLYVVGNRVYFGEITFFPASGFKGFHPKEWNKRLGDMIVLPQRKSITR